jgi:hypothetical protein
MMERSSPADLISRHLDRLASRPDVAQKVDQVLERCDLVRSHDGLRKRAGEISAADCQRYKEALKHIYGDAIYRFARVNFMLGGCACDDCHSQAMQ